MTIPFTYIITHIPSNVKYYGVRFAKGCNPSDLGSTYFSSSNVVKDLIKQEGVDNFRFQVRRAFMNKEDALKWENRFLERVDAARSDKWFNRSNGNKKFYITEFTEEMKQKMRKPKSEETKQNMRKPKSSEHRTKLKEHLDKVRTIPEWTNEKKTTLSIKMSGEGNHNFGRSDHPGAIKFQEIAKARKGKTREELYGAEKAAEMKQKCRRPPSTQQPCPHCGHLNKPSYMKKWHFDNCKQRA